MVDPNGNNDNYIIIKSSLLSCASQCNHVHTAGQACYIFRKWSMRIYRDLQSRVSERAQVFIAALITNCKRHKKKALCFSKLSLNRADLNNLGKYLIVYISPNAK